LTGLAGDTVAGMARKQTSPKSVSLSAFIGGFADYPRFIAACRFGERLRTTSRGFAESEYRQMDHEERKSTKKAATRWSSCFGRGKGDKPNY